MVLPITPPFSPMEAQLVSTMPTGKQWLYEPKWDGFRCLIFKDGDAVQLQSKAGKPLGRYFPEIIEVIRRIDADGFVLDGEIVVPIKGLFSFDHLLRRTHPVKDRINRLARELPASMILFDLLVEDKHPMIDLPLSKRRKRLERFFEDHFAGRPDFTLSEVTLDGAAARKWLESSGINLDGIMAKRIDLPYRPGERDAMKKVKKMRTVDCVVGGFRYSASSYEGERLAEKGRRQVGSLLLGLYDGRGLLHHVGSCSGLTDDERTSLVGQLEPLIDPPGFTGRMPGGPGRLNTERPGRWEPLSPRMVVEIQWAHFAGGRFRHGTRLMRWRPDKEPAQCTLDQVEKTAPGILHS